MRSLHGFNKEGGCEEKQGAVDTSSPIDNAPGAQGLPLILLEVQVAGRGRGTPSDGDGHIIHVQVGVGEALDLVASALYRCIVLTRGLIPGDLETSGADDVVLRSFWKCCRYFRCAQI